MRRQVKRDVVGQTEHGSARRDKLRLFFCKIIGNENWVGEKYRGNILTIGLAFSDLSLGCLNKSVTAA